MTRINCVPVTELHNKHLVGEYKEIVRVYKAAYKWVAANKEELHELPTTYRMGKGHVKFFYNKLQYICERWHQLRSEMISRGYNPQIEDLSQLWRYTRVRLPNGDMFTPLFLWGSWQPSERDMAINRARIRERLIAMGEVGENA